MRGVIAAADEASAAVINAWGGWFFAATEQNARRGRQATDHATPPKQASVANASKANATRGGSEALPRRRRARGCRQTDTRAPTHPRRSGKEGRRSRDQARGEARAARTLAVWSDDVAFRRGVVAVWSDDVACVSDTF